MNHKTMLEKWKKIQESLKAAGDQINNSLRHHQLYKDYETFLNHNELELALDSLLELIENSRVKNHHLLEIWNKLYAAAEEMELSNTKAKIKDSIAKLEY